jgi:molybdopterin biosynthesis enzyme
MKLEEEVKRVKNRVDNVEENRKEQHSLKSMAVSDLVALISEKRKAVEAGDSGKIDQLNKDYPLLLVMDCDKLETHFEKHPIEN